MAKKDAYIKEFELTISFRAEAAQLERLNTLLRQKRKLTRIDRSEFARVVMGLETSPDYTISEDERYYLLGIETPKGRKRRDGDIDTIETRLRGALPKLSEHQRAFFLRHLNHTLNQIEAETREKGSSSATNDGVSNKDYKMISNA